MKFALDKTMFYASYLYLTLPYIIFAIGWFRWYYALLVSLSLAISLFYIFKNNSNFIDIDLNKHKGKILITIGIIFTVIFFSGMGGFTYQFEDFQYRNAMLRDLIDNKWPVIYKMDTTDIQHPFYGKICMYVYYIAYWLPAALVGKILGWQAANLFLFLWTVIGLLLIYYHICRYLNRFSLKILWVFLFFDGLYIYVSFFKFPFLSVATVDYKLWSNNLLFPFSAITQVYWFFNQSIGTWLVTILLLNNKSSKNILYIYVLSFLFSPYAFIGLFPFVLYFMYKNVFLNSDSNNIVNNIIDFFSLQNIIGVICIILPVYLYYSTNLSSSHFSIQHSKIQHYVVFVLVSFILISILIFNKFRREPLYYIIIVTLFIIPILNIGYIPGFFGARASIPALFILSVLVASYLIKENNKNKIIAVYTYLLLCSVSTILEISRSLCFKIMSYTNTEYLNNYLYNRDEDWSYQKTIGKKPEGDKTMNLLIQDDLKTLNNPKNQAIRNYLGPIDKSVFYKYIAKQNMPD